MPNYLFTVRMARLEEDMESFMKDVIVKFPTYFSRMATSEAFSVQYDLTSQLNGSNVLPAHDPGIQAPAYSEALPFEMSPEIHHVVKMADRLDVRSRTGLEFPKSVWEEAFQDHSVEIPSLQALALRARSMYCSTLRKVNGKNRWFNAALGLFEKKKWVNTLLTQQSGAHSPPDLFADVWQHAAEIEAYLDMKMGLDEYVGKRDHPITLEPVGKAYMGSAGGLDQGERVNVSLPGGTLKVSPTDKKFTKVISDIDRMGDFLAGGPEPAVYYNCAPKHEMKYHDRKTWERQNTEDLAKMEAKLAKCRVFVIPNSVLTAAERSVCTPVFQLEQQPPVMIGFKWGHGGADRLAELLGINPDDEWKKILADGDISGFDHGVFKILLDWYFKRLSRYDKPSTPMAEMREKIIEFIRKNITTRYTHFVMGLWFIVLGGVPSGCFNTSHMDSIINMFYLISFFVHTIKNAAPEHVHILEEAMVDDLLFVVYGDDFVYRVGRNPIVLTYFHVERYALFLKKYYNITLRDFGMRSFLSLLQDGDFAIEGTIFLRHRLILNPNKGERQPRYLPCRATDEYIIRAVVGKAQPGRTVLDIMLSVIGHAYGTYAANRDAYDKLSCLFSSCVFFLDTAPSYALAKIWDTMSEDSIRDMRRKGIGKEEIIRGFPTWEDLVKKNEIDKAYHSKNVSEDCEWDYLEDF